MPSMPAIRCEPKHSKWEESGILLNNVLLNLSWNINVDVSSPCLNWSYGAQLPSCHETAPGTSLRVKRCFVKWAENWLTGGNVKMLLWVQHGSDEYWRCVGESRERTTCLTANIWINSDILLSLTLEKLVKKLQWFIWKNKVFKEKNQCKHCIP